MDVDAGGTSGTAVGSVSIVGSWTVGLTLTGVSASDSWAARLPDNGGAVELCSAVMVGLRGAPVVTRMVLRAWLMSVSLCAS